MKNSGFSLVEVLVSLGLVGVLGGVTSSIISQMSRADAQAVQFTETIILAATIADSLKDDAVCDANFNGLNPTTNPTLTGITGSVGQVATVGQIIVPQNIRLSSLVITNFYPLNGGTSGVAELDITIEQLYNGVVINQRSIPIFLDVDLNATGTIARCRLSGASRVNEAFCNAVGGTMSAGMCTSINSIGNYTVTGTTTVTGAATSRTNFSSNSVTSTGIFRTTSMTSGTYNYTGPGIVTGNLSLSGTGRFHGIVSQGPICLAGVCRTFIGSNCAGGMYGYGINADGSLRCRMIPPPPPPPPPPPLPP